MSGRAVFLFTAMFPASSVVNGQILFLVVDFVFKGNFFSLALSSTVYGFDKYNTHVRTYPCFLRYPTFG